MNVFVDRHHEDLYHSLRMLFEKRLGWNLYRPIGEDWFTRGYWAYYTHPETVKQFLTTEPGNLLPRDRINEVERVEDGVSYCFDPNKDGEYERAITFDKFMSMPIDIVISSVASHDSIYKRLCEIHPSKPKHIVQLGNIGQHSNLDYDVAKNIMSSTAPFQVPEGINAVFYHQEFDLDLFSYIEPSSSKTIRSFVNLLPMTKDYPLYQTYKERLPDYTFQSFGGQCEDGSIGKTKDLAKAIQESQFVWHVKPGGDGFGHVLHNAFACGRPVITRKSHYIDKLGGILMKDMETCIDLDVRNLDDNLNLIRELSKPENHNILCQNVYNKFKEVVNFEREVIEIKAFLNQLL